MLDKPVIKNLLVPLDGSLLAESVLPYTAQISRKIKVSVTLIHIIEKDAPETVHGQRHLTNPAQAEEYLNSIASSDVFKEIPVKIHVHEARVENIPRSIADHSAELNQDLVIMCTHGSSGFHDMLFGSIAQQVISLGITPVLLINPANEKYSKNCNFETFLIPLDGNPDHEQALDYASIFAGMCGAKLHLLIAIPLFGTMSGGFNAIHRLLPGTTSKMLDMIVPDAEVYLQEQKTKLEESGLKVTVSASRSNPEKAILEASKKIKADVIILATHGKKGADAFWEGSVTPKISKTSKVPLLLIPVKE